MLKYEYPEMYREHPELVREMIAKLMEKEESPKPGRKNQTGSNEKTKQRERNKENCYKLYDELMEKAKSMPPAEIKKAIAAKLHMTVKTVNAYLRERP